MLRPRSPPSLNFTGMVLPAFTSLMAGGLFTGLKKPSQLKRGTGGWSKVPVPTLGFVLFGRVLITRYEYVVHGCSPVSSTRWLWTSLSSRGVVSIGTSSACEVDASSGSGVSHVMVPLSAPPALYFKVLTKYGSVISFSFHGFP